MSFFPARTLAIIFAPSESRKLALSSQPSASKSTRLLARGIHPTGSLRTNTAWTIEQPRGICNELRENGPRWWRWGNPTNPSVPSLCPWRNSLNGPWPTIHIDSLDIPQSAVGNFLQSKKHSVRLWIMPQLAWNIFFSSESLAHNDWEPDWEPSFSSFTFSAFYKNKVYV